MIEVWLLESHYNEHDNFFELYWHFTDTNIWITDEGYSCEDLRVTYFTKNFWADKENEHLWTYLGRL